MADVLVEETHGILWVTLNRPERLNALSRDVNLKLQDIAHGFEQREDVRVVVLELRADLDELLVDGERERIARIGTIERDPRGRAALLDEDVGHARDGTTSQPALPGGARAPASRGAP